MINELKMHHMSYHYHPMRYGDIYYPYLYLLGDNYPFEYVDFLFANAIKCNVAICGINSSIKWIDAKKLMHGYSIVIDTK